MVVAALATLLAASSTCKFNVALRLLAIGALFGVNFTPLSAAITVAATPAMV